MNKFFENIMNKGKISAQNAVYLIIVAVIIYLVVQVIKAMLNFDTFFSWWSSNGGSDYVGFDMASFALFQQSRIAFTLRQLFIPGQDKLNFTDIMLIQSIALNQAKVLTAADGKTPVDGNFVLPHHLLNGIAWSSADDPVFQNLFKYWMSAYSDASVGGITTLKGYDWPGLYSQITKDWPGPEDTKAWKTLTGNENCQGFWPHQNGCYNFFDTPVGSTTSYDLLTNPARSCIGEIKSLQNGTAPMYINKSSNFKPTPVNNCYLNGDINADKTLGEKYAVYYIPGYPGPQGSWAQLFADFGIIYTELSRGGNSKVPVVSDGALCGGDDDRTPMDPCPIGCPTLPYDSQGKTITCGDSYKGAGVPLSDFTIWNETSRWITGGGSSGIDTYGPNFFSAFRMDPQSFIFTSWVGNIYDDPTTGIILDPQAIKNLIGMSAGGLKGQEGGWIRFFKGINTDLKSYDEIMNELFTKYATQFTPRAQIKNTSTQCGAKGWLSAATSMLGAFTMMAFLPAGSGLLLYGVFAASGILAGVSSAYSSGCF